MSMWYVVLNGKREGPFSVDQVQAMAQSSPLPSDALVWTEGMANWAPLATTPLAEALSNVLAPPSLPVGASLQSASDAGAAAALGFVEAVKVAFQKYADFKGRAGRAEYWWFVLFIVLCMLVIWIPIVGVLLALALIVPSISATVRRLHDTDRSGWWYLISFVPLVGAIVLIIFCAQKGTDGPNRFG